MRDETVARSYAETLFELAAKHDALEAYGEGIDTIATLLEDNPKARMFLETPRIDDDVKKDAVQKVLGDVLPQHIVNFVLVTIDKRRQRLLRSIAQQYHALLDEHMGREHVQVTVARQVDDATREVIAERLSADTRQGSDPARAGAAGDRRRPRGANR